MLYTIRIQTTPILTETHRWCNG